MFDFLRSQKFLKALVFAGLLGLIVLIFSQKINLTTSDLGRHLANGRVVWNNPDILFHNAYSYTEPDFCFINHHWLYGIIIYAVYSVAGFVGLSIFNILVIIAAFCLAFRIASKKISSAGTNLFGRAKVDGFFFSSLISLPVIFLLSERIEVRPEIFSYLFIVLTYYLLEAAIDKKKYRRLWLLLPLFALWANIHIYFFIGLALVGFKAAAIFINAFLEKREGVLKFFHRDRFLSAWRESRFLIIIFFASASVCLLNPNTWRGLVYPFNIFKNYGYQIAENKSIFFLEHLTINYNFCLFKLVFVLLLASWIFYAINLKKGIGVKEWISTFFTKRSFDFFISLFIAGLAFFSSRNISLFGLVSLIVIGANMAPVLVSLKERNERRLSIRQHFFNPPFRCVHSLVLVFLIILIIISFFCLVSDPYHNNHLIQHSFGLGLSEGNEDSAVFFKENNLRGPIFNDYDIGSALIFWLYPQEKVFVDNRPEAYSNAFFNDIYKPIQTDTEKWNEYAEKYGFKTIYITHTDGTPWTQQFLRRILKDQRWRLVYFDAYAVILIDSQKYSASEVKNLSLDAWAFKARLRELTAGKDLRAKLNLANLAESDGLPELAEEVYREVLSGYPDQAQTLFSLAGLYANYKDQASLERSLYYSQRALDAGLHLPGVYNQRGLVYWQLKQYKKAEGAWRSALECERKNTDALYYLNQVENLKKEGQLPTD